MKKIEEDLELIKFDGVDAVHVYKGCFADLEPADLKWNVNDDPDTVKAYRMELEYLKLSEIAEQLKDSDMITIFIEEPLHGSILQYGNYGPEWWVIGDTAGYA